MSLWGSGFNSFFNANATFRTLKEFHSWTHMNALVCYNYIIIALVFSVLKKQENKRKECGAPEVTLHQKLGHTQGSKRTLLQPTYDIWQVKIKFHDLQQGI